MTNQDFSQTDKSFLEACKRAGIAPSRRQASKFRLGFGKAYQSRPNTRIDISDDYRVSAIAT